MRARTTACVTFRCGHKFLIAKGDVIPVDCETCDPAAATAEWPINEELKTLATIMSDSFGRIWVVHHHAYVCADPAVDSDLSGVLERVEDLVESQVKMDDRGSRGLRNVRAARETLRQERS